ncbi:MAG: AzlD domain-containing protein [Betaproteobacteria bacterium]|jgi:branched-subunit amino acid transport protein AzlD|uniref:Uncharacterized protein n=2 Tax=Serpentinimonas TaxID=2490452 RepID=A0A060NM89_9BURK|nr:MULTISPECIES: AzlD domain-containing protein [Serpentinimonas]KJS77001.1 MAG: hypothetical protein JM57_00790 [Comamonadaceae bacterium BICA1-1]MBA4253299.1 L-valine transporter subunit YgaH [Comamonadaceae bacterium]MBX9756318.1 AzlD domain-containing protein [Pseudomonadaceae bacterium]MCL5969398.1 AzlD domain-containing protein [Betaproteobacteria bacterium]MDO8274839.1 AzlD domain-containing protein [Serpentinimonas sp.]OYX59858.1 MAG: hypothetical protein B7Y96_03700 [Comamonadaceae b
MTLIEAFTVLAAALVTFLLRWLPMLVWRNAASAPTTGVKSILNGIGPAAICAMLVLALGSLLELEWQLNAWLPALIGVLAVFAAKWRLGGIAWPTLFGALAYGLSMHLF